MSMLVEPLAQYLVRRVHAFFQQPSVGAFRGFLGLVEPFDQIGMWIQLAHVAMIVTFLVFSNKILAWVAFSIIDEITSWQLLPNYQFLSS